MEHEENHKDEEFRSSEVSGYKERCLSCLRINMLTIATVGGVFGGVLVGIICKAIKPEWTPREVMYMSYIGDLFLRMLKCLIIPLITASLISAIGGIDLKLSGKIGTRAVVYYLTTTVCAVIIGIILVSAIRPGEWDNDDIKTQADSEKRNVTSADTLMDLLRNCFPPNLIQSTMYSYRTTLSPPAADPALEDLLLWDISGKWREGTNMLGLVIFSVVMGVCIGVEGERAKPLLNFFVAMSECMMTMTTWVIWLSPVGILFLVAGQVLGMEDYSVIAGRLGMYFMTVLLGLILHGFIVLPIIFSVITRTLPFKFVSNMASALATAFGTDSSSATLPLTIKCIEEKNGIDQRVSRFVLPIGATINMDGTALYEAVAGIFIAQIRGVALDIGSIIAISITATAAAIGAAGIPQAGLVTLVMVLDTVGLPAEDVAYILAVDWLLDRCRTTINVLGDSFGAAIVQHLSEEELRGIPIEEPRRSSKEEIDMVEVTSSKPE